MQPDHELHMNEVHALADEARAAAPSASPPQGAAGSHGLIAPIYMGKDHEVVPDRYVLHYSTTVCKNCNRIAQDSEFYALSYIKSRINGTRVRHLVKCATPLYNLPVDRIPTRTDYVPYCVECPPITLDHLPPPPAPSQLTTLPDPQLKGKKPKESKAKPVETPIEDLA